MTNLMAQLDELVEQLNINNSATDAKTEIESLNKVKKHANVFATQLSKARQVCYALATVDTELAHPVEVDDVTRQQLKASIASFEILMRLWSQNGDLSQGDELDNALSSCRVSIDQVNELNHTVWVQWVAAIKGRALVPESLLTSQRNLTSVEQVVKSYDDLEGRLQSLLQSMPDSPDTVVTCQHLAGQLQALQEQMEFDIPEDVERFLKAFTLNRQTDLRSLTPQVLEWLGKKNMLGNFVLRRVH